jgi:hypothetical protein
MSKDLRDYIVKLNDRNIQRQRETGFTLYAILGAIIYCVFYLIDNLSVLTLAKNSDQYYLVIVITSNIVFTLFIINLTFLTKTRKTRNTKVFHQEPLKIEFRDIPVFLAFGIISYLNFHSIQFSPCSIFTCFLTAFGVIVLLNFLSPFAAVIIRRVILYKKKKRGNSVEIIDFTMFNGKATKLFTISLLSYSAIMISLIIAAIVYAGIEFTSDAISLTVKFTLVLYGLLYLLKCAIETRSKKNKNTELEDFEKEIFFEQLSDEEIAKRFENDFDGIPFSKWLDKKQIEVYQFFEKKRGEFLNIDYLITQVDQIDKDKMPYEFNGRLEGIIKEQSRLLSETGDFVQKTSNAFKNLRAFASLNNNEFAQLNTVQTLFQNNVSGFNISYSNVSDKILGRQRL